MIFAFLVLVLIALAVVAANICIVPQSAAYVVERLGVYAATWEAGMHFKTPFVERVVKKVSLKEQRDHADRHGGLFPGHRPQNVHLWRRAPAGSN